MDGNFSFRDTTSRNVSSSVWSTLQKSNEGNPTTPPRSGNTSKLIILKITIYTTEYSRIASNCAILVPDLVKDVDYQVSTTSYQLYSALFDGSVLKNNSSVLFKGLSRSKPDDNIQQVPAASKQGVPCVWSY